MSNIEDGTYRARATSGILGETSTGKEQVAVDFELLDIEGRPHMQWFGYFTEKTEKRTIESLRICGWTGNDLTDLSGIDANEVDVVVRAEEYNGQWRPKIQWVNRAGGAALASQLAPDKAKAFAARMKAKIAAFDQGQAMNGGGKKAPAPTPAPKVAARTNGKAAPAQGVLSPEPPPIADSPDDLPF